MTETGPVGSQDRMIGLEPVDGLAFESDGTPIGELDVDAPDSLLDRGETIAEQAIGERSWRFGHVIVDEAQDLTPMQWRMIARRSHGGGITLVGDLAQRSIGESGEWADHLPPDFQGFAQSELTINYRSPAEINELASAVLAELAPGLSGSQSIRSVGTRPTVARLGDLDGELAAYLRQCRAERPDGRLAVIGLDLCQEGRAPNERSGDDALSGALDGTVFLDPWQAKGLEFDSVVLVEPARFLDERHGLSLLYVAITRTTNELAIVHHRPLPALLAAAIDG
ncbi:MAG: ATP-binding domain-containing protein [Acidimicrobiia bacterium]|nr:ATP-binding domain-containing protein [Acidimicrobiia bacterium]